MNNNSKNLARTAMMIAVTAALSQVALPIPPVPLTLQTAAVILTAIILGPGRGAAAMLGYILLGCLGVPVFAQFKAGPGVLLGPTGGFLYGFVAAAFIIGFLLRHEKTRTLKRAFPAVAAGIAVIYLFGVVHFAFVMGISISAAFKTAALPFLPLEALKIIVFTPVALRVKKSLSALS
ncbi:MAG: biotin transporter BioY [Clostridiales bacterium]|nr:biotin transporter BioY [Clostridiales bacterium]